MSIFKTGVGEVRLPVAEYDKRLSGEFHKAREVNVAHDESVVSVVEKMNRGHLDEPLRAPRSLVMSQALACAREEGSEGIEKAGRDESDETYYGPAAYYGFKGLVAIIAGQEIIPVGYCHTAPLDLVYRRNREDLQAEGVGEVRSEPVVMVAAGDIDFRSAAGEPADRLEDIAVVTGEDAGVLEPEIEGIAYEIEARSTLDGSEEITEKDPLPLFGGVQFFGALFMVLEMCV